MKRYVLTSLVGGLIALTVVVGSVQADHVKSTLVPSAPGSPTVSLPETLQVDGITAQEVRARAIYANRIDADRVQGMVHQISGLTELHGHGEIRATDVTASVIYADTINANLVAADTVYVRDLRIK